MPRPLPRPPIKGIINLGKKILPILCPNPNLSFTLLQKLTFKCN